MTSRPLILFFLFLLISLPSFSQAGLDNQGKQLDVLSYRFEVYLNDSSDFVKVATQIELVAYTDRLVFGLDNDMQVDEVLLNGEKVTFSHEQDQLKVASASISNDTLVMEVVCMGQPSNGLYISSNKYGKRTFFTDHWPNRAQSWLPVIDHPSEKATVEFVVVAPSHYQVVSNGILQSVTKLNSSYSRTHWKCNQAIPTKVMAIGVAEFSTHRLDAASQVWVYNEEEEIAFRDFNEANEVRNYLVGEIGPFPFDKIDHVVSTTRYGGMENASCIFYNEHSVNGDGDINKLIAHEVAHQWFGNCVTESDWEHVWLSEGFATYYEERYLQDRYGLDSLKSYLQFAKAKIKNYEQLHPQSTILQKNVGEINEILTPLTYEKAAWMLRSLSHWLGSEQYDQVVSLYLAKYAYGNASTQDFIDLVNSVSEEPMDDFFYQWLEVSGGADVSFTWKYKKGGLELKFEQHTDHVYQLKIDVEVQHKSNAFEIMTVDLKNRTQTITIKNVGEQSSLILDPMNIIYGDLYKVKK
ncbi:MAG: M1 family metallopeptidase [Reichenbachiella sp.]